MWGCRPRTTLGMVEEVDEDDDRNIDNYSTVTALLQLLLLLFLYHYIIVIIIIIIIIIILLLRAPFITIKPLAKPPLAKPQGSGLGDSARARAPPASGPSCASQRPRRPAPAPGVRQVDILYIVIIYSNYVIIYSNYNYI